MSYQNLPPSSFQNVIQAESTEATLEIPMYSDKDFKQIFKSLVLNDKKLIAHNPLVDSFYTLIVGLTMFKSDNNNTQENIL